MDVVNDTVTLANGTTFDFNDAGYADRLTSFKQGDQVAISWHHVGSTTEVSAISPVNAATAGNQAADQVDHVTQRY